MNDVESLLRAVGADFTAIDHPPVFTCEEASRHLAGVGGVPTKNLFLKSKSGAFILLVTSEHKRVDLKRLAAIVGESKLSFGSADELHAVLGISAGAVSVLAAINDRDKRVRVVCDSDIWGIEALHCHPLVNTRTLLIKPKDIGVLLETTGHRAELIAVPERAEGA